MPSKTIIFDDDPEIVDKSDTELGEFQETVNLLNQNVPKDHDLMLLQQPHGEDSLKPEDTADPEH